jgi:hypothetical protein
MPSIGGQAGEARLPFYIFLMITAIPKEPQERF